MARKIADLHKELAEKSLKFQEGMSKDELMDILMVDYAKKNPPELPLLPQIYPQLAQNSQDLSQDKFDEMLADPNFVVEPKLDGMRSVGYFIGGLYRTSSRRRSEVTYRLSEFGDNVQHLIEGVDLKDMEGTVLDGEMLSVTPRIPTKKKYRAKDKEVIAAKAKVGDIVFTDDILNATVTLCNQDSVRSIELQKEYGYLGCHVYDILRYKGRDVTGLPMRERRQLIEQVLREDLKNNPHWNLIEQSKTDDKMAFYHKCINRGQEGIMLKDISAPYREGKRVWAWTKLKDTQSLDVFITGSLDGKKGGKYEGMVGSFTYSIIDTKTDETVEVGHCIPGDDEFRAQVTAPDGSLKPEYLNKVIEVRTQGITKNRRFRHSAILRWRPDRSWDSCQEEYSKWFPTTGIKSKSLSKV